LEKLMYLVWLPEGTAPQRVGEVMLGEVAPALVAAGARALTMDVDDEHAQVPPPAPPPEGENPVCAVVSLWLDAYDWRAPFEDILRKPSARIAGYQAVESMYRDYGDNQWSARRDWPDGTRSPGILTVSVFEQKRDMDFDDWIAFWHTKQSPMSEVIQPRARYVRNALFRAITPDAPPYRAIVEEAWPTVDDLTDPMRFYCADGDAELLQRNVTTMLDHVTTFIDFDTFRNYTLSEWIIKSL
jgi:hypothetical protein